MSQRQIYAQCADKNPISEFSREQTRPCMREFTKVGRPFWKASWQLAMWPVPLTVAPENMLIFHNILYILLQHYRTVSILSFSLLEGETFESKYSFFIFVGI